MMDSGKEMRTYSVGVGEAVGMGGGLYGRPLWSVAIGQNESITPKHDGRAAIKAPTPRHRPPTPLRMGPLCTLTGIEPVNITIDE